MPLTELLAVIYGCDCVAHKLRSRSSRCSSIARYGTGDVNFRISTTAHSLEATPVPPANRPTSAPALRSVLQCSSL